MISLHCWTPSHVHNSFMNLWFRKTVFSLFTHTPHTSICFSTPSWIHQCQFPEGVSQRLHFMLSRKKKGTRWIFTYGNTVVAAGDFVLNLSPSQDKSVFQLNNRPSYVILIMNICYTALELAPRIMVCYSILMHDNTKDDKWKVYQLQRSQITRNEISN